MTKFLKIGIPFLIVMGFASVYLTGSLGETAIRQQVRKPAFLVAKEYYGLAGEQRFKSLMNEVSALNKKKGLSGTFAVLYENNPDVNKDSLYIWVGALQENPNLPSEGTDWQIIPLLSSKIVQAEVNATALFSPGPAEVNRRLEGFATAQNLPLDERILELYQPDGSILTQREIRNN